MYRVFRRILFSLIVVTIVLGALALQRPSQSTESAVVFSNMPDSSNFTSGSAGPATQGFLIFDIPVGPDYRINSVQITLNSTFCCQTAVARIHADNGGDVGAVVVELGALPAPQGIANYTFTPTGAAVLPNGGRYWLVITSPGFDMEWQSGTPPITPTGVFSFVSNGTILLNSNTLAISDLRHKVSIDADPVGSVLVNDQPWRTTAIYCQSDGGYDVYGITDGAGWFAFRITQEEIDAVGIPSVNTLLKQTEDGKIRLYRLTTGEFQVNAPRWDNIYGNIPDGYVYIWEPVDCE